MKYIADRTRDPALHHALEEYFLTEKDDEFFMLWRNRPAVLIGRNQNIYREVNLSYCEEEGIDVVRRISGGGAIYTEENNFQYSFIAEDLKEDSFRHFAAPVIDALKNLGLDAAFTGRNDILLEGKKISGNAQYHYKNKVIHHGTVLYDVNREKMGKALKPNPAKFKKKSIDSVQSRVALVKDYIGMDAEEFMEYLTDFIRKKNAAEEYVPTKEDFSAAERIKKERYGNPAWTYGKNPKSDFAFQRIHPSGIVEYGLEIKGGILDNITIEGDFFSKVPVARLEDVLKGTPFNAPALEKRLETVDVSEYIKGLSKEDLLKDLLTER